MKEPMMLTYAELIRRLFQAKWRLLLLTGGFTLLMLWTWGQWLRHYEVSAGFEIGRQFSIIDHPKTYWMAVAAPNVVRGQLLADVRVQRVVDQTRFFTIFCQHVDADSAVRQCNEALAGIVAAHQHIYNNNIARIQQKMQHLEVAVTKIRAASSALEKNAPKLRAAWLVKQAEFITTSTEFELTLTGYQIVMSSGVLHPTRVTQKVSKPRLLYDFNRAGLTVVFFLLSALLSVCCYLLFVGICAQWRLLG